MKKISEINLQIVIMNHKLMSHINESVVKMMGDYPLSFGCCEIVPIVQVPIKS